MTPFLPEVGPGAAACLCPGGQGQRKRSEARRGWNGLFLFSQVDPLSEEGWKQKPNLNAIRCLEAVIRVHSEFGEGLPLSCPGRTSGF